MATSNVFAEFIHTKSAMFKHAKGMRDIFGLEFHPFHEIFLFIDGDADQRYLLRDSPRGSEES